MKLKVLAVNDFKETWLKELVQIYKKKLGFFSSFEVVSIKPSKGARGQETEKIKRETLALLQSLDDKDYIILCDERGQSYDSVQFSKHLNVLFEQYSNRSIVFIVGGAYGVSADIILRAHEKLQLSPLVMNHHIALSVLLEQLYRAHTIQKGIPYHNS